MKQFKKGFLDGIPIGLGYLVVSFTFGIQAMQRGLSIWQAVLISMMNLTSAGQAAGLNIMYSAGSMIEMALAQLVINSRYSLMSLSLTQKIDKSISIPKRFFFGCFHTDEIYAVAIGQEGKITSKYFTGLILAPYVGWTLGTLLGAICGEILPSIIVNALGVALYGMFIAIIVPPTKKNRVLLCVVAISMILSMVFAITPILKEISSGFKVIILTLLIAGFAAYFFPIKEEGEANEG